MTPKQQLLLAAIPLVIGAGYGLLRFIKREDFQRELRVAHRGLAKAKAEGDEQGAAYWEAIIEDLHRSRERQHKEK